MCVLQQRSAVVHQVITANGDLVDVPIAVIQRFHANIQAALANDQPIELEYVTTQALHRIRTYVEMHMRRPDFPNIDIDDWDRNFINGLGNAVKTQLLTAARYLNLMDLYWVCARGIARMGEGMYVDELRDLYG